MTESCSKAVLLPLTSEESSRTVGGPDGRDRGSATVTLATHPPSAVGVAEVITTIDSPTGPNSDTTTVGLKTRAEKRLLTGPSEAESDCQRLDLTMSNSPCTNRVPS